jgi:hypothetical protein
VQTKLRGIKLVDRLTALRNKLECHIWHFPRRVTGMKIDLPPLLPSWLEHVCSVRTSVPIRFAPHKCAMIETRDELVTTLTRTRHFPIPFGTLV